jgi:hypothetical protein
MLGQLVGFQRTVKPRCPFLVSVTVTYKRAKFEPVRHRRLLVAVIAEPDKIIILRKHTMLLTPPCPTPTPVQARKLTQPMATSESLKGRKRAVWLTIQPFLPRNQRPFPDELALGSRDPWARLA